MQKKRIAIIRQNYTPYGGAEKFIERVVNAMTSTDVRVTMVTRTWHESDDHDVIRCNPFYLGRTWRDSGFERCACRALKDKHFDIVQSHTRVACCDVHRAGDGLHRVWLQQRARARGRMSKILTSLSLYHRYILNAEARLYNNPALKAVICNSVMVKNEILEKFSIAPEKLHVIYSGVDSDSFSLELSQIHRTKVRNELGIPDDDFVFLFVGSGFERKGLKVAIEALAQMKVSAHLLVVGYDRKQAKYQEIADVPGVRDRVHFIGPAKDVRPYYGAADCFVFPTLYDPFPNVALEAFASGLPVITSTKSGAAELITDSENGYVTDALDVDGLASVMMKVMHAENFSLMREKARKTIEHLTWDNMVKNYLDLYETILS
jgi:UDP-glucose:(heptosyl)LPS alpha-1,3-glucosyltransferase